MKASRGANRPRDGPSAAGEWVRVKVRGKLMVELRLGLEFGLG